MRASGREVVPHPTYIGRQRGNSVLKSGDFDADPLWLDAPAAREASVFRDTRSPSMHRPTEPANLRLSGDHKVAGCLDRGVEGEFVVLGGGRGFADRFSAGAEF